MRINLLPKKVLRTGMPEMDGYPEPDVPEVPAGHC
jgi:hypothetical protein